MRNFSIFMSIIMMFLAAIAIWKERWDVGTYLVCLAIYFRVD